MNLILGILFQPVYFLINLFSGMSLLFFGASAPFMNLQCTAACKMLTAVHWVVVKFQKLC